MRVGLYPLVGSKQTRGIVTALSRITPRPDTHGRGYQLYKHYVYSYVAVESEQVGGIDKCRMGLRNCSQGITLLRAD